MRAVTELLKHHPSAGVFVWCFFKSILPVPTPSLTALAGATIEAPGARAAFVPIFLYVGVPGAAGLTIGGFVLYWLARYRGEELVRRLGPRFGRQWQVVERARRKLGGHRGSLIGGLRALPFIPVMAGAIAAGLLEAPVAEFAAWSFGGGIVRCVLLGYAGFLFKRMEGNAAHARWGASAAVALGAAVCGALLWLVFRPRAGAGSSSTRAA